VNKIGADAYQKYEDVQAMPIGSTIVKPSFTLSSDGQASLGPFFVMEKMVRGFDAETADWRYAMVMPGGQTVGITGGTNSAAMNFCAECHSGAEDNDQLFFLPEEVRK
ncbi:MAG: cytochrome P460 family protein, partial [Pseudomonadota bacterium]